MAKISYREALNAALREELDRDERVFIMGEEVGYFGGAFKVTDGLLAVYGEKRVRDTPISELVIVGAGVGAAMGGLKPVVELMTINFALLAIDQVVNHAAKIRYMFGGKAKVPLIIRAPQVEVTARRATQPEPRGILPPLPRTASRNSRNSRRCEGTAQDRDSPERSGDVPGTRIALRGQRRGSRRQGLPGAVRQGVDTSGGQGPHNRVIFEVRV